MLASPLSKPATEQKCDGPESRGETASPGNTSLKPLRFQRIEPSRKLMERLDALPDRTLFQTRPWLDFLAKTQKAEPVFEEVSAGETTIGFFTGLIVKKAGFRILGSPFRGWTTPYLGFNMLADCSRARAVEGLKQHAFQQLGCVHVELMDRLLAPGEAAGGGLRFNVFRTHEINLEKPEAEVLAGMHDSVRRYVRRAAKQRRVIIEEASPVGFAEEYFAQLLDVFAKRSLVPTYDLNRVRALIDCVFPSGRILLLRARDTTGRSIGTGIFPAYNGVMYFWGGASLRSFQKLHPNEPLQWYAMQYWKRRGVKRYDMGGGGQYKEKYGGSLVEIPWISESDGWIFRCLRNAARSWHAALQHVHGFAAKRRSRPITASVPRPLAG